MTAGSTQAAIARGVTLLHRIGAAPGDRVVVQLGQDLTTFGVLAAACLEGVVTVPLPADLPAAERREIVLDADPSAIVADPTLVRRDPAADVDVPVHATEPATLGALPGTDPSAAWPRTRPMAYTSGTTGRRKGVYVGVHDPDWGRAVHADELAAFDRRHGDHHLVVSPLYHSGPLRFALVTALTGGEVTVLPSFDAAGWRATLRAQRPDSVFCVPTHLHRLLALPDLERGDLASLQLLAHAGAPCPEPLKRRVLDVAPEGSVWEFYGSTEGQFTVCPPQVWRAAPGSVGRARAGSRIEVRREDGAVAAEHEVGTVWCHAPGHARFRYWRDPARTAAAWDGDAFTVGDLGALDGGGRLRLAGRPGDLVISGGVNVYPARVERLLLTEEGVAEAVVFGVPDEEWGQRVVAAVVPWPGATLDPGRLCGALAAQLRRAEVPRTIIVVDELPRTATGKVRRVGLAEAFDGTWDTT
ncbi:class I adenylate-forming enzyme family protein [Nitriliruptor alkaliphilus]|uniref:class I adenylate-forming enzyme family protein n=1 Tax=Nitriliruptor alkaliphilus TaxID=427918 RepID=UPI000698FDEB|nr:AMP-binding protein [Nitriliruptor alkaliphilus]